MESLTIWGVACLVALLVFVPYFLSFRRSRRSDAERREETRALGMDRPTGQYPQVDANACIGCRTCVDACPEGDVLGVVGGKAVVINGARCIGHGFCAEACPVGAMKVGLGDVSERDDIPLLSGDLESSVPGVFVAGELGGFALISNAVKQGCQAALAVAARGPFADDGPWDLVVAGAGPCGLSAALTARERGLRCLLLDQQPPGGTILQYPRRKLVMVQPVAVPLYGRLDAGEYSKEQLLEIWLHLHEAYELRARTDAKLLGVEGAAGDFSVRTTAGDFRARYVLLALGRRGTPRRLGVPGEDASKVAYRLIDASLYRNERVLVVGGGDSAVEAAVALAGQEGTEVTLSYRKPEFLRVKKRNREKIEAAIAAGEVRFLGSSRVVSIGPENVELETADGSLSLGNDFVFVFAGGTPPFPLLKEIGIAFGGEQVDPRRVMSPI